MNEFCKKQELIIKDLEVMIKGVNKNIINSAVKALDNVNEMQDFYLSTSNNTFECGENILRVYALLQGLFVGIDSLYSLAEIVCGSKTFININQNKGLKAVKYIRNDVVGHPVNRVYDDNQKACCVLDKSDIKQNVIKYTVYYDDYETTRVIDLLDCLHNYYLESNELLSYLLRFYNHNINNDSLVSTTKEFYDSFNPDNCDVSNIKSFFINHYKNDNVNQNRFIWRINLIDEFKNFKCDDKYIKEVIDYALFYQAKRILEMSYELEHQKIDVTLDLRFPKYLYLFSKFLKSNPKFIDYLGKLKDIDHPYFDKTFSNMRHIANNENNLPLVHFFDWILENKSNGEVVYLIGALFKLIRV